jgi:outer membrane cobalamin receptor
MPAPRRRSLAEPATLLLAPLLLAGGLGLGPQGALAQADPLASISLDSLLSVPVHSAARHAQTLAEAPASVTIITAEDIARHQYRTLADILQRVRGFHQSTDRNYTSVGVRGISRPNDYGNRVVVMLDGQIMNDNVFGAPYVDDALGIPLGELERVEIVRGPGSALFGTGAMLTVIDLVTRRSPTPGAPAGSAQLEVGSRGHRQADLLLQGPTLQGVRTRLSARVGASDGEDLYFPEFDDPDFNHGVAEGLDWERHAGVVVTGQGDHLRVRVRASTRSKGIPTGAYGIDFNHPDAATTDQFLAGEVVHARRWSPGLASEARLFADRFLYRGTYPSGGEYHDRTIGIRGGVESHLTWDPSPRHRVIVGGEVEANRRADYRAVYLGEVTFDGDFPFQVVSVFLHDEFHVTPRLTLTTGLRHDRYSFGEAMTVPRAALVLRTHRGGAFKAIYGEAFRAPNIYEREVELPEESRANPDLRAEHLRSTELVWEQRLARPLYGSLSLFENRIRNLVDAIIDPETELFVFVNRGEARVRGVEVELDARASDGVSAYLNAILQDPRDGHGEALTNTPRAMVKLGAALPVGAGAWLAPELRWEGGRRTLAGTTTRGGMVARVAANVRAGDRVGVSLVGDDLLDSRLETPGGFEHAMATLPQPGRTLRLRIQYAF